VRALKSPSEKAQGLPLHEAKRDALEQPEGNRGDGEQRERLPDPRLEAGELDEDGEHTSGEDSYPAADEEIAAVRGPEAVVAGEREVLTLMAEGLSNNGICGRLFLSPKTVETHVHSIFMKLRLPPAADDHRRVLAVLAFLRAD
jgi:DNA-binding NarL/FixJ family response regulator